MRVGARIESGPVTVEVVRAAHKHGRGPHSRVSAEPVGFVVAGSGRRVYFPGDTDLFDEMADLGDIDVALLPICIPLLFDNAPTALAAKAPQPTRKASRSNTIPTGSAPAAPVAR